MHFGPIGAEPRANKTNKENWIRTQQESLASSARVPRCSRDRLLLLWPSARKGEENMHKNVSISRF